MTLQYDPLLPPLLEVSDGPEQRRSKRTLPEGLQVELTLHHQSKGCICLNISHHGIALLIEPGGVIASQQVTLNLYCEEQSIEGLSGTVLRIERSGRFQTLAIAFDESPTVQSSMRRLLNTDR